jgi:ATP-binding cassette subfamily B (MDR/TAP) protein 1
MPALTAPINDENRDDIIADIKLYAGLVACVGVVMFISMSGSKWAFGILGEEVTFAIRHDLYSAILRKHLGFHDHRENGSSALTSAMAEDSAIINGVSTESLGPQVDGFTGLLVALLIGFIFSWKVALTCLALAPFMTIGQFIQMKAQHAHEKDDGSSTKDANLLCGDAIMNYKTVQSFGHEDKLVEKYM